MTLIYEYRNERGHLLSVMAHNVNELVENYHYWLGLLRQQGQYIGTYRLIGVSTIEHVRWANLGEHYLVWSVYYQRRDVCNTP